MNIMFKYTYLENGVYVISEEERPGFNQCILPWNISKDSVKLAVGYIRWSDEKQNNGHSFSIQEREIIIKAKSRGFQAVVIFVEAATTAFNKPIKERIKMSEMKEFILSNFNANTVIFYDESRLTRLIADFYFDFIVPVREKNPNLKLFSTKMEEEWNENNPLVQMRLILDYEESQKKSYRARNYQETIISESEIPERPPTRLPYGYSKSDDSDELVPNENASIVKFIFYLYSFGYSEQKIADLLTNSKVPSPSAYSNWSDSSVRYILTNKWYTGKMVWFSRMSYSNSTKKPDEQTSLFSNHHPSLIESGLWEATQFLRGTKKNKDRMDSRFILRNLVFCSDCNSQLKTKNPTSKKSKKDESIYICQNCKSKTKIDFLHQKVISDFSQRWSRELKYHLNEFNKTLKIWKRLTEITIQELANDIQNLRYKESSLHRNEEHYDVMNEAINYQLNFKQQAKSLYMKTLSRIEELLEEDALTLELIDRFKQDFHLYSNEEKRSILLQSIKKIDFDFKRTHFVIEYRLSPYVEIETVVDSISKQKTS